MTTRSSKAGLIAALKQVGISIPANAKDATMELLRHRLRYWRSGKGFLIRLVRPPSIKANSPLVLLEKGKTYWIPNSRMATDLIKTQLVFVMGRTPKPPKDAIVMDVPQDYNERWPLGWNTKKEDLGYGSNDDTDS